MLPENQPEPLDPAFHVIGDNGSIIIEGSSLGMSIQTNKEYLKPDFSEIGDAKSLSSAKKLVKQARDDGGAVFHMKGEGHSIAYAQDKTSLEWPGNDALEDGFIKVVYAKDFF